SDPAKKVLLNLIKARGVEFNITCADRVLLVEPWWNPFVEVSAPCKLYLALIASDRTKPVIVYRLYIQASIETDIVETQSDKAEKINWVLEQCVTTYAVTEGAPSECWVINDDADQYY
ncbi:hypothetical protein BV22DRAFT_1016775, partial [Leucogyrophana mollusca]